MKFFTMLLRHGAEHLLASTCKCRVALFHYCLTYWSNGIISMSSVHGYIPLAGKQTHSWSCCKLKSWALRSRIKPCPFNTLLRLQHKYHINFWALTWILQKGGIASSNLLAPMTTKLDLYLYLAPPWGAQSNPSVCVDTRALIKMTFKQRGVMGANSSHCEVLSRMRTGPGDKYKTGLGGVTCSLHQHLTAWAPAMCPKHACSQHLTVVSAPWHMAIGFGTPVFSC